MVNDLTYNYCECTSTTERTYSENASTVGFEQNILVLLSSQILQCRYKTGTMPSDSPVHHNKRTEYDLGRVIKGSLPNQ